MNLNMGTTWATAVNNAGILNYQYSLGKHLREVNHRIYTETTLVGGDVQMSANYLRAGVRGNFSVRGKLAVARSSYNPAITRVDKNPKTISEILNLGSSLLRSTVPEKPEVNLMRFIGEQREAPMLFRAANYVPRSFQDLGGSFLNYVFGVKPTHSDLQKMSEIVEKSTPILHDFIQSENRWIRRHKSLTLDEFTDDDVFDFTAQRPSDVSGVDTALGLALQAQNVTCFDNNGWGPLTSVFRISRTLSYKKTVEAFGTYKYFVPHPTGIGDRLTEYQRQARRLLGGGLNASTVYDLTPWTWLANWFVDIGGVLRYQQAVADNNVVAFRQGLTYRSEATTSGNLRLLYVTSGGSNASNQWDGTHAFSATPAFARFVYTRRFPGSPYSFNPDTSLTASQKVILTALAASKIPGA